MAYRLTDNANYHTTELDTITHLFGRNYDGCSFITGLGVKQLIGKTTK
ncbi:hypothetical protein HMPREF3034_02296 [Prevotella sp. DNF00663]|nr:MULTISPECIES: hypothetical protein [unclassified Prevotella]KXB78849.1 hypothetical protein HMPREF3034_02296 [Prevotella sp. DNF00663]